MVCFLRFVFTLREYRQLPKRHVYKLHIKTMVIAHYKIGIMDQHLSQTFRKSRASCSTSRKQVSFLYVNIQTIWSKDASQMLAPSSITIITISTLSSLYYKRQAVFAFGNSPCRPLLPRGLVCRFESRWRHGCLPSSFCVVLFCVARGLASGVQGVLPTVEKHSL